MIFEVLGVPPELRRGLDIDLEELAEEDEALLPGAADDDGEVVHRLPIDTPFCMATSLLMTSSYCG